MKLLSSITALAAWVFVGFIALDNGASNALSVGIGFVAFVIMVELTYPNESMKR